MQDLSSKTYRMKVSLVKSVALKFPTLLRGILWFMYVFPTFVHFYTVNHFHYTYVPAGALTLKILRFIQYLFQHNTSWTTSKFIRNAFKKHWLKHMVKTYNRLSSILLHVSDVEHPSSGSIAAIHCYSRLHPCAAILPDDGCWTSETCRRTDDSLLYVLTSVF
jgi:hypothetical protein